VIRVEAGERLLALASPQICRSFSAFFAFFAARFSLIDF